MRHAGREYARALLAQRRQTIWRGFNPNHDDKGRFSESDGGGGGGSADTHSLVAAFETREQAAAPTETALLVDESGTPMFSQHGDTGGVQFSKEQIDQIRGSRATLTHNHPNGTSLSNPDVHFAAEMDMAEIRAFGTYGGKTYVYSVKSEPGAWAKHEPAVYHDAMKNSEADARTAKVTTMVESGKDWSDEEKDQARNDIQHEAMQNFASKFPGLTYTRKEL